MKIKKKDKKLEDAYKRLDKAFFDLYESLS
jgi:ubiquitin